ncbi:SMI1/KNR4 family protein [Roseofilum casamattae]|uniref:SMI1/KNR4 family protein n=1 Tax=Roseofilum casamattae BLCC-M143 TaxID=3022442 RepID=A0ABT7BTI0_9CYAN|nr:SMI1/KNR4 family protein [Roseofilum casamattae]MDJ1182489.1 SMI1/KNR4 family protein [Roseofilum casamattae BLCC-M143]
MYIEVVKQKVKENKFLAKTGFRPCRELEVALLEQKLNLSLPLAYKEFLLWAGHNSGLLFEGSDATYEDVLEINKTQVAKELFEDNNYTHTLPEDAFVFWVHQGYQLMFFRTSEGDNPPVYFWKDSFRDEYFEKVYSTFTDCLLGEIEFVIKIEKELRS